MSNSPVWDFFVEVLRGAPMVVSSNWAAYLISGFLFVLNFLWRLTDSRGPWRDRFREVLKSKRKDAFRGVALLVLFWSILFCASFKSVLHGKLTSLEAAQNQIRELQGQISTLSSENAGLKTQLAAAKEVAESPTSLRRRTVNLVYDIAEFWALHPSTIAAKVQNPTTDEERQRNAAYDKYWAGVGVAYRRREFNQRISGIVNEYKSKGVPAGFLAAYETQPDRMLGAPWFGGVNPLDNCAGFGSDICQLYELAYHVNAYDQRIDLLPKLPK
jgi:hypothetical protein